MLVKIINAHKGNSWEGLMKQKGGLVGNFIGDRKIKKAYFKVETSLFE